MKKIVLICLLSLVFLFAPRVQAGTLEYDTTAINDLWAVTTYSGNYAIELYDDQPYPDVGYQYYIVIPYIPSPPFAFTNTDVASVGGINSTVKLYDGATLVETINITASFIDYAWENNVDQSITIDLATGTMYTLTDSTTFDPTGVDAIRVTMMQSFGSVPSGFESVYQTLSESVLYRPGFTVYYYSQFSLYREIFAPGYITIPSDPTPPTDYTFRGWKTITGELLDEDSLTIDETWLLEDDDGYYYMNLYASFVNVYDPNLEYDPTPDDNSPPGVLGILDAFGFDNDAGKSIIFFTVAFVVVVLMLLVPAFRRAPFVIDVVLTVIAGLFLFLGWLPVYVSIIVLLILVLVGVWLMRGSSPGGVESD